MRKLALWISVLALAAQAAHGQELALTAAQKQKILRGGVLTLFGSRLPDELGTADARTKFAADVKTSGATYLRWLGYFWTGVEKVGHPTDYNGRWNDYFAAYQAVTTEVHRQSPAVYAEFATPEIVTEEVSKIVVTDDIKTFVKSKTGIILPATFDFTKVRADTPQHGTDADYVWSCVYHADEGGCTAAGGYMKNGVPSLSKEQGRQWIVYLAARALKSGANAIFIVPAHDTGARNPWKDLATTVTAIRAMKPNVIIGTSGLSSLPRPPAGIVPRNQTDFMKTFLDIDIYQTNAAGLRTVAPARGTTNRVPCYTLTAADNNQYLPANNAEENLCIVKNPIGRRPVMPDQRSSIGRNQIEYNPYKLPILLEYDPALTSCGGIYLPNPNPDLTSQCTAGIRHGMSVSTIFPMSVSAIRQRYIQYSYRLGVKLTREKGFPVYAFGWLDYGEGVEILPAWRKAQSDSRYVAQKDVVRMMPANASDTRGIVIGNLPPRSYRVSYVQGDLDALKAAITYAVGSP